MLKKKKIEEPMVNIDKMLRDTDSDTGTERENMEY